MLTIRGSRDVGLGFRVQSLEFRVESSGLRAGLRAGG
jgi:hypothetical protein